MKYLDDNSTGDVRDLATIRQAVAETLAAYGRLPQSALLAPVTHYDMQIILDILAAICDAASAPPEDPLSQNKKIQEPLKHKKKYPQSTE